MPAHGSNSTPIRNATVRGAAGAEGDADVEIINGSNTSDSLKALVGSAYEGKAVWATVSSGGGLTDRVTYRCPGLILDSNQIHQFLGLFKALMTTMSIP